MNDPGGQDLLKQFNKGIEYAQNTFNVAEGVDSIVPTLLFKGVVIDVNFEVSKSTISAALLPPFSVYAKIIGQDGSSADPLEETERTYYPPFFPMHNICIPEVGEEVLIFKETPEPSAAGYYVGRVNDSTPLNISYARDYVGINDPETRNSFRYGFNFDVRELRKKFSYRSPSVETANISIPLTFGDVVQQGRSKTYVRQSFNRNNKKGVLEQGIRVDGQLAPAGANNIFRYYGSNDGSYQINDGSQPATETFPMRVNTSDDEDGDGVEEIVEIQVKNDKSYAVPSGQMLRQSQDPSIGETSTKTIHFIDSSIKRLGNYTYQSIDAGKQNNNLEGEDKAMIVNIADEIYNISSREVSGSLYRQVLGEKLVQQQRQTYVMINQVLKMVSGFAESTQNLLDAFLEHEHAIPKIDLNLEKTIKVKEKVHTPPKFVPQPDLIVTSPSRRIRVQNGTNAQGRPIYSYTNIPGSKHVIPQPPKLVKNPQTRTVVREQKINFESIVGGAENPRFTAPIAISTSNIENHTTSVGEKTEKVYKDLENIRVSFQQQQEILQQLTAKVSKVLSKNQFVN